MELDAAAFAGRATFVTGPGKHCGKTTFLNRALALAGRSSTPAVMGIGFDGEGRDALSAVRKPEIPVMPGWVFLSAERYLRPSGSCPEILAVLPGRGALGRLCLARARREGRVTLVGPESVAALASAIDEVRSGGWADAILVDGAINRITQLASVPGARFFFALRVEPATLARMARKAATLRELVRLPLVAAIPRGAYAHEGPITAANAQEVAAAAVAACEREGGVPGGPLAVVDDFTKVFLDGRELKVFRRSAGLAVRAAIESAGFAVAGRDVSLADFAAASGIPEGELFGNPYEAGRVA